MCASYKNMCALFQEHTCTLHFLIKFEDHIVLHLSKNEEKDDDLPYPKFRKFKQLAAQIINKHEEHAFPTAADDVESSTSYQPPPDAIMGLAVYPPARQNLKPTYKLDYQFGYPQGKGNTFYGGY
ncbi:hypothetical protein Tco_1118923, partial [Tanacetum coccineum]